MMRAKTELGKECRSPQTSMPMDETPVFPVRKAIRPGQSKARIRVYGGYSVTVNSQLETHRHPIPLPTDLMRNLRGGYCFTKVDLADAHNKIKLASESQKRLVQQYSQRSTAADAITFWDQVGTWILPAAGSYGAAHQRSAWSSYIYGRHTGQ